jgi:uncharacterized protein YcbK (DUF882 family)
MKFACKPEPSDASHRRVTISRRTFLNRVGIAAAATMLLPSTEAFAKALTQERKLTLINSNTREDLTVVCSPQQHYDRKLLSKVNYLMRDHRTDEARSMDPALLDLLYAVTVLTKGRGEYNIISAYRAPETNHMLRKMGQHVAEHSLHMDGKAVDFRTEDLSIRTVQKAAIALERGGVGYYANANFIHLDTGDVRTW